MEFKAGKNVTLSQKLVLVREGKDFKTGSINLMFEHILAKDTVDIAIIGQYAVQITATKLRVSKRPTKADPKPELKTYDIDSSYIKKFEVSESCVGKLVDEYLLPDIG